MADALNPNSSSSDYQKMQEYWKMVDVILGGAQAMRNNAGTYLPRYQNETQKDYAERIAWAPLTNIYADISRNLASKPFAKQLNVGDETPDAIKGAIDVATNVRQPALIDNIDGRGNNLHAFASSVFKSGIDDGLTWVMVDYSAANDLAEDPDRAAPRSQAEEKALGLRPFWLHLPALKVLAAYSDFDNGTEILVHVRIDESTKVRNGWGETATERVRVINREKLADGTYGAATWALYEKQQQEDKSEAWVETDHGVYSIGVIPMVCFFTGERDGSSFVVAPPLRDLAYMQVEEFQQESALKTAKMLTAFPMLVGEGVSNPGADPETGQKVIVPVGPRTVLFPGSNSSGGNATFKFIEPSATSLKFLEDSLATFRKEMRDLGMQPLTEANLTVITTANVAMKASSAVQAWAILFQDALEQCFTLTSLWLREPDTTDVLIHTDFAIDGTDSTQPEVLLKAVSQAVLSKRTARAEFKRRSILSDEFDEDAEEQRIAEEMQGLEPEVAIDPVTGEQIQAPVGRAIILQKPQGPAEISAVEQNADNPRAA